MSVVRRFYPEVSLRDLIGEPGGIKIGAALEQASANIEMMRDDGMAAIDAKIAKLQSLTANDNLDDLASCYPISDEIFAEAGAFGLTEVSRVAHSLCSLLSAESLLLVPRQAVRVHLEAMVALRSAAISNSPALRTAVLAELTRLSARFAT
ncbi:hypothetical protein [Candidatus Viadribacter manganicus]|uniref:HPt domain-containing protein n=1 Tax=Candidatus Viadribacter manganicus TaxID=1759059 RepID=A0A1B1AGJ0_9PROT|nr:hypothetical protein [Candidatus Viadribacter manganicus]ANP45670.1 hypothetical protein ATE48_06915 [Candidatus Viadribacter manganicus]